MYLDIGIGQDVFLHDQKTTTILIGKKKKEGSHFSEEREDLNAYVSDNCTNHMLKHGFGIKVVKKASTETRRNYKNQEANMYSAALFEKRMRISSLKCSKRSRMLYAKGVYMSQGALFSPHFMLQYIIWPHYLCVHICISSGFE